MTDRPARRPRAHRHRHLGGHRLPRPVLRAISRGRRRLDALEPAAIRALHAIRFVGLLIGIVVFGLVVFSHYERAVTVSGRSEVIAVRSDGSDFSRWTLADASVLKPDADASDGAPGQASAQTSAQAPAQTSVELAAGATARFVRRGRGPMLIEFTPSSRPGRTPGPADCTDGEQPVGTLARVDAAPVTLCDGTRIRLPVKSDDVPLVVSLRGTVTVGEEVRAGAGRQPILLDGSAQLLVRHGEPFTWFCKWKPLNSICERFVATTFTVAAGDTLNFRHDEHAAEATGFLRIDPEDLAGGLRYDLAASDAELEVRRMKGEAFELSESPFERIEKSPLLLTLNATLVAISLVWWFVRIPSAAREGPGAAIALLALASLLLPAPARAQQALLRAGETGQALLRSRADRCYAVTPQHVLAGETSASLVLERRALADADLLRRVPAAPEAMAVLLTRAVPPDLCPAFATMPALDGLLRARAGAVLRLMRPDGSVDRLPLAVLSIDVETFEVRPQEPGDVLAQGMSGGTILIDDQPAGLLTDVRDEGRIGRAARLDRIFDRLEPYLGAGLATQAAPPKAGAVGGQATLTLVRWSAESVTPANRADELLNDAGPPWRVSDPAAEIVFRLGPERAILSAVTLDAGGLTDPPRQVEILLGGNERGPWRSVANFALEPGDGTRLVPLPPTRAGFVLMRARQHQPDQPTMALKRFGLVIAP